MVAKRSNERLFKANVDAATLLFQIDLSEAWSRLQRLPFTLDISDLRDVCETCIRKGFDQFLALARQFPRKAADPVKWAQESAASVITRKITDHHPASGDVCPQLLLLLRQVAAEEILRRPTIAAPAQEGAPFTPSDDYRSIRFKGTLHKVTGNQATIIKLLHEAHLKGTPAVGKQELLAAIGSETSRVQDSFKQSPLWGTLVVSNRKPRGTYQLNLE